MHTKAKQSRTLLVVEDHKADAEMIRILLEESGLYFELVNAGSLSDAFSKLQDRPHIDLVLLDLGLPDSTGFHTLTKYLERFPDIPVVVMTGLNDQRKGMESVRAGAQDYLVKGEFESAQLVKVINYSLERFRQRLDAENRAMVAQAEKQRLTDIHELASLGTWEMDIVKNTMTWSRELFTLFQLKPNAFSPSLSDYLGYVHRDDKDKLTEFLSKAQQEEEYGPIEYQIIIDNRIIKKLSLRTRLRFEDKTNSILLVGTVYDITPHQAAPGPEPAPPEPVPEEVKPVVLDNEMIHLISFNIRTPLSTVVNLLYLLEQTALSPKQSRLVQDIKTTFDELSFTLSNLVNLSILTNDKLINAQDNFRPLDILESIQRVMAFKGQQHNREVDIYIDSSLAVAVQGDSNKLAQLFFCMMELAFMQSKAASFIKLRCTMEEAGDTPQMLVQLEYVGQLPKWPEVASQASAEEILALLQPKDVMQGKEQLVATVFLRLCSHLQAEQQFTTVQGSVFMELSIPLQAGRLVKSVVPEHPARKTNVLLVEDHPMHQIATRQLLTTWSDKVNVTIAGNGRIALEKFREATFDIILMDLQMPVMDGMAATAQIRQVSNVPIIALTASNSKQEEDRCHQVGMNDYLPKPFQPEELYKKIMLLIHSE